MILGLRYYKTKPSAREPLLIGIDPEAHNPTKFFIRAEFKDERAEAIETVSNRVPGSRLSV